ncbi:hypothetical protein AAMO2058_001425400 [Amorphochlora amoebiformis]
MSVLGRSNKLYYRTEMTAPILLDRAAMHHPNGEILTYLGDGKCHVTTYRMHRIRVRKLQWALTNRGFTQSDVIGTFMWNNARHLQIYHTVPCMGCILHTINIRLHPEKLTYIIRHAEDKAIFVDQSLVYLLSKLPGKAFQGLKLFVINGSKEGPLDPSSSLTLPFLPKTCEVIGYEKLIGEAPKVLNIQWPILHEDMPMVLCYTSGTTGMPKGVLYSHRSQYVTILGNLAAGQQGFRPIDTALPIVPMFHAMAWGIPYAALAAGCNIVLANEHMKPHIVADLILKYRVTVLSGVPLIWQAVKKTLLSNPTKYQPIRCHFKRGTVGGSKFALNLLRWFWDNWGVEVIQTWGMTETNPLGTAARRLDGQQQLKAFSDKHLDTVVISNYFKRVDNPPSGAFVDGWLNTGDLASITSNGYIAIHDRAKDVIKSGGEWISSVDMENHIKALAEVHLACVVGVEHPVWDERPIAVVQLENPKSTISLERIRSHCATRFAKFQLPDDVVIWEEVPISGTGKIDKKIVRARLKSNGYVLPALRKSTITPARSIASKL